MSDADLRQDEELENNRRTDKAQWVALAAVAIGFSVYVNVILGKALSVQGEALRTITQSCTGKQ